ncbi:MAG: amidohydrolase [Verrucomicrobia bacterium]|nr:amidohydrolase [Verrucomicrobiota bacterium]
MSDTDSISAKVEEALGRLAPRLSETRRHLHRNPELSGTEFATTAYLSERLAAANVAHRLGPENRGIITESMPAESPGAPTVALRADIDALPIQEANPVEYRSRHPGVMHACGHDAHASILLGLTLSLRQEVALRLPVAWRAIFQPAEEVGQGALEMIRQGALTGVEAVLALHVDPNRPWGTVGITPGPRTAWCQDFSIEVTGRGGHGARPHDAVDPIAAAAHLITLIYQGLPRQNDVRKPMVVTIGTIRGGRAANVIPDQVSMKGTIRSIDQPTTERVRESLARLCAGVAHSFQASIVPTFEPLLPGLVNDPVVAGVCARAARELLGDAAVATDDPISMGAEDFAEYTRLVPGCMISLGVNTPGRSITPIHTPTFDIDERALLIGARLLARVLLRWPTARATPN